ncbi:MAG: hypothetical protein K0V04_12275 [Deltaproteobacteria bacterium]|nr:hypothetical protein [Deltaproteobacteria bacterium]
MKCPQCDHELKIETSLARMGAVLGAAVGAASRRGFGVGGLLRGAAIGGGVAYLLERFMTPRCPSCSGATPTPTAPTES